MGQQVAARSVAAMARPCGGHLTTANVAERLDAVFGEQPRRIYGALVLADAGASITECSAAVLRVAAAVAPDPGVAAAHKVRAVVEPESTLLAWSEQPPLLRPYIGECTWLSTLERAALEAVDANDVSMFPLEVAAKALSWGLAGSPDRIVAAAAELGRDRSLRMLRSLAAALRNRRGTRPVPTPEGMLHPDYDTLVLPSTHQAAGEWVVIDDLETDGADLTFYDDANRVAWRDEPERTIDNVLY